MMIGQHNADSETVLKIGEYHVERTRYIQTPRLKTLSYKDEASRPVADTLANENRHLILIMIHK